MGSFSSKVVYSGTLQGAYAPPLPNTPIPPPLRGEKKFRVVVPEGKKGGDTMTISDDGVLTDITIPRYNPDTKNIYKSGEKFIYQREAEIKKVIASTLPTLPGTIIVESKPIIWASVSHSFNTHATNIGKTVATLMQEAQEALLKKTIDVECNSVLGVSTNVTTDSGGRDGLNKLVIVTMTGTPCKVVPTEIVPPITAEAVLIPIDNYNEDNNNS